MPITFEIEPVHRVILATAVGIISAADLIEHTHAKVRGEIAGADELFDARDATFDLSTADLLEIARSVRGALADAPPGKCAVLTGSLLLYSLVKTYTSLAGKASPEIRVFTTPEEACHWLGLPASTRRHPLAPGKAVRLPLSPS